MEFVGFSNRRLTLQFLTVFSHLCSTVYAGIIRWKTYAYVSDGPYTTRFAVSPGVPPLLGSPARVDGTRRQKAGGLMTNCLQRTNRKQLAPSIAAAKADARHSHLWRTPGTVPSNAGKAYSRTRTRPFETRRGQLSRMALTESKSLISHEARGM